MATQQVRDIDRGWKKFLRGISKHKDEVVIIVGIQGKEAAAERDGITNAALGAIHEFGAPGAGIPQRSFQRSTIDRERRKYETAMQKIAVRISDGKSTRSEFEKIGLLAVSDIKRTFNSSIGLVANAPATIAAKGSSTPLIDIAVLRDSHTAVVQ